MPPNCKKDAFAEFTSPTVKLPDGTFVMDSINIAKKLESMYPSPSLRLDTHLHEPVTEAVGICAFGLWPDGSLSTFRNVLSDRSALWFAEDRKKRVGMFLEELSTQKGGEAAWKALESPGGPFDMLKDVLTRHRKDSGPFVLGSEVSYGDFVAASLFEGIARTDAKIYDRMMGHDKSFQMLHKACSAWLERDN